MKILITGGGTGGHFYPLIAVAEKINEIAILLSGEEISQESLAQAKVLVMEAQKELH